MQDISRDEFNLLSGDCGDRDTKSSCNIESAEQTKLTSCHVDDLKSVTIKLEDVDNYSSWPINEFGLNLLRNSEDPLISGARNDNHQNELQQSIEICDNISATKVIGSPTIIPTITPTILRKKSTRVRRKGQVKLRFHHQALPPEYLDHYETTQNNLQKKLNQKNNLNNNSMISLLESQNKLIEEDPNNSVRNWLQKISELQDEEILLSLVKNETIDVDAQLSLLPLTTTTTTAAVVAAVPVTPLQISTPIIVGPKKSSRVYNYSDLPYMGEMTLENSKPRRGRKPKKADICHLIYKNYGQIFPGTPKHMKGNMDKQSATTNNNNNNTNNNLVEEKKSDIQNKIISSLLEKRLTQNSNKTNSLKQLGTIKEPLKKIPTGSSVTTLSSTSSTSPTTISQAEPLNLCLRDNKVRKQSRILHHKNNIIINKNQMEPLDIATDPILAGELKIPLPNFQEKILKNPSLKSDISTKTETDRGTPPEGYVYWPAASVFIHPMALYYQKLADGTVSPSEPNTISTPTTPSINNNKSLNSNSTSSSSSVILPTVPINKINSTKLLVAKDISELMKRDNSKQTTTSVSSKCSETSSNSSKTVISTVPQKRKRSAIFIPPMPSENSTNPTTEVSICKFKFTGGAKPSLQEKKMLSVDSGGNFRYYSGTGDKSMRGYEFFPRESLQQSSLMAGSSSGAFLSTPGEKITTDETYPSLDLTNDVLQITDFTPPIPNEIILPTTTIQSTTNNTPTILTTIPSTRSSTALERKKKKSRRSLQREKLEKTFKEKGFLIQTQQLESAEGATYCKFRQLTKFTRYLFRSWKDYLPGDLQQQPGSTLPINSILPSNGSDPCISQSISKSEK